MQPHTIWLLVVLAPLPLALVFYIVVGLLPPWMAAHRAGLPIGLVQVLDMRIHGVNAWLVVQVLKRLRETPPLPNAADLPEVETPDVAEAYLYGVDLRAMLHRLDEAAARNEPFDFWGFVDDDCRRRGVPLPQDIPPPEEPPPPAEAERPT